MILNEIIGFGFFVLALAAFLAGFIDAIVGGGGLVQLPALFSVYPKEIPATLFGINKLSAIGGTFVAATQYVKRVSLPKKLLLLAAINSLIGSFLGAWTLTLTSPDFIRKLLPFILSILLLFTLKNKNFGLNEYKPNENMRCLMGFLDRAQVHFLCFYLCDF